MLWLVYVSIAVILLVFIVVNFTTLLHPKNRLHPLQETYSSMHDVWKVREGNKDLVILLHGMYANPDTFDTLPDHLVQEGWDVYVPSLPACARTLKELQRVGPWTWDESLAIAMQKVEEQKGKYERIVLGGHSQGGSLAMTIATKVDFLSGLMVIASPVSLYGKQLSFVKNLGVSLSGTLYFLFPKGVRMSADSSTERKNVEYVSDAEQIIYPLTIHTFKKGLARLRSHLSLIKVPLFLAYEKGDNLVDFASYEYIRSHVSSKFIYDKVFATPHSQEPYGQRHHLPSYKPIKEELYRSIEEFLHEL